MPASGSVTTVWAAVATPAALITSLQKDFEPSSRAAAAVGPKHLIPSAPERVSHPGYQWRLGTDDHEIDIESPRERDYRLGVLRVERRIGDVDLTRDPGIARAAQDLGALRRARQRLDERVLARAAPEDQNPGAQIAPMKSSIGIALSVS